MWLYHFISHSYVWQCIKVPVTSGAPHSRKKCDLTLHFSDNKLFWSSFYVLIDHSYILWSILTAVCYFFNWIICLLMIKMIEYFIYSGHKSFVWYMLCKCFLPVLTFRSLINFLKIKSLLFLENHIATTCCVIP